MKENTFCIGRDRKSFRTFTVADLEKAISAAACVAVTITGLPKGDDLAKVIELPIGDLAAIDDGTEVSDWLDNIFYPIDVSFSDVLDWLTWYATQADNVPRRFLLLLDSE